VTFEIAIWSLIAAALLAVPAIVWWDQRADPIALTADEEERIHRQLDWIAPRRDEPAEPLERPGVHTR
jgi:hypothetical protein